MPPRFPEPCGAFPESSTTLDRLIWGWEKLRDLNTNGYQSSRARPMSTWLIGIEWAGGSQNGPSPGRGTSCSPFTTQAAAIAYATETESPFRPKLSNGSALGSLFSTLANGRFNAQNHARQCQAVGLTPAQIPRDANHWAQSTVFFNLASRIEPGDMRRGDVVGIQWMSPPGHATYCWDVLLNNQGQVVAFQYVSSNGTLSVPEGRGPGVSVSGCGAGRRTPAFPQGFLKQTSESPPVYEKKKDPYFADHEDFVKYGSWCTWIPELVPGANAGNRYSVPMRTALRTGMIGARRVEPQGNITLCRYVGVARLHGVRPPEPYAPGGNPMPVPAHTPPVAPVVVPGADLARDEAAVRERAAPVEQDTAAPTSDQQQVEEMLKLLYEIGRIDADPGTPDAVNDARSRASLQAFQRANGLPPRGNADARTRRTLRRVYGVALHTPEGQRFRDTGVGTRPPAGGGAAPGPNAPAQAAPNAPAQAAPNAPAQAAPNAPAQAAPNAPAQAAPNAPAQAAPNAPAQAAPNAPAQAGGAPSIEVFTWRHGFAAGGTNVRVLLHAQNADGRSYPLKLKNSKTGESRDTGLQLRVANGEAFADVPVPRPLPTAGQGAGQAAAGPEYAEFIAIADGLGETGAPLLVEAGPPPAHLALRLLDGLGREKLAGVRYRVLSGGAVKYEGTTDAGGVLRHPDVPRVSYTVEVTSPEGVKHSLEAPWIDAPEPPHILIVPGFRAFQAFFQLVAENGAPIANEDCIVTWSEGSKRVRTDGQGRVREGPFPLGQVTVSVRGRPTRAQTIPATAVAPQVQIVRGLARP